MDEHDTICASTAEQSGLQRLMLTQCTALGRAAWHSCL